jgi:hypothetical protein
MELSSQLAAQAGAKNNSRALATMKHSQNARHVDPDIRRQLPRATSCCRVRQRFRSRFVVGRCWLYGEAKQPPATADSLIQHLEIDVHRLTRKIAFEVQHTLLLIESWRFDAHEKDKRDWSDSIGSSSAVPGAYIASSIPRQRYVFVRGQGASPYRATANTRKRRWRPPQI